MSRVDREAIERTVTRLVEEHAPVRIVAIENHKPIIAAVLIEHEIPFVFNGEDVLVGKQNEQAVIDAILTRLK